jgi:hypothetical protein
MARSVISKPTVVFCVPFAFLGVEHVAAEELGLVPADDPAEVSFDDGRVLVDVVAVKAHRGFKAQRIARAEAGRDQAMRFPRLQ